jgi:hypothetical protein
VGKEEKERELEARKEEKFWTLIPENLALPLITHVIFVVLLLSLSSNHAVAYSKKHMDNFSNYRPEDTSAVV